MYLEEKIQFFSEKPSINISKNLGEGKYFYVTVVFENDLFIELQKNLFNEFIVDILSELEKSEIDIDNFKNYFEKKLQSFNSKLNIFVEKLKIEEKLHIKGVIQIIIDNVYINSMIGEVSTLVFRNSKLSYLVENDILDGNIDLFSEYLEGEIENEDEIIVLGIKITDYLTKQDINQAIEVAQIEEKTIFEILQDLLGNYVQLSKISFLSYLKVNIPFYNIVDKKTNLIDKFLILNNKDKFIEFFKKNKFFILLSFLVIILFYGIYAFVNSLFFSSDENKVKDEQIISCNTNEISRKINDLQYIDNNWDLKVKTYNEIKSTISKCKQLGYAVVDMQQLEKVLEKKYFETFNIFYIQKLADNKIYTISEENLEKLGDLIVLLWGKFINLNIFGSKGAIFGVLGNVQDGKLFEYNILDEIKGCNKGFDYRSFYCYSSGSNLYYLSKNFIKKVYSDAGFPKNIVDIDKYSTDRLFILTDNKDLNNKGTFVLRYDKINDTKFKSYIEYKIEDKEWNDKKHLFSSGFSDFIVDNSWFLLFNKKDRNIYLMKRKGGYTNYSTTIWKINMQAGPSDIQKLSENVKIITNNTPGKNNYSRYIYLFDKDNKTLWAYMGPAKRTNVNFNPVNFKNLYYKFILDLSDFDIVDVDIRVKGTPILYILEKNGNIYRYDLAEYFYIVENEK